MLLLWPHKTPLGGYLLFSGYICIPEYQESIYIAQCGSLHDGTLFIKFWRRALFVFFFFCFKHFIEQMFNYSTISVCGSGLDAFEEIVDS